MRTARPQAPSPKGEGGSTSPIRVLSRTFVHVPGIGAATERALWADGVQSWRQFLRSSSLRVPIRARDKVCDFLEGSDAALQKGDARFFARHLPRSEWWRLYPHFRKKAVFLDIETTGLSHHYDEVTVIGLYDGSRAKIFLAGQNIGEFAQHLAPYDLVITFNGALFDLPFLRSAFPTVSLPPIHLDLRYILKRIGYSGPLKNIERRLGIAREQAADIDGLKATVLWARYLRGDIDALEQLVKYNAADITSLESLMDFSYGCLARNLLNGNSRTSSVGMPRRPRRVSVRLHRPEGVATHLVVDGAYTTLMNQESNGPHVTLADLRSSLPAHVREPRIVGIDLTGSERRPTGVAFLAGTRAETTLLSADKEIEEAVLRYKPDVVSIDSPLGLPRGRCCTKDSCSCRVHGILRECERVLWRRGVRVYPCLLPSMQGLTSRGIRIAARLRARGIAVIESYPGAAQDIMRIPRKRASLLDLANGLTAFGVSLPEKDGITHDELDAVTAAIVGLFFWSGRFEALGHEDEEHLIVPGREVDPGWLGRSVIGLSGPISAGKTTVARRFEERGYFYARFSQVLADLLNAEGVVVTRQALQSLGERIHDNPGQRWLCRQLFLRLPKTGDIIVDGLRHPEDRGFFVERFGPTFTHVHLNASTSLRRERYVRLGHSGKNFDAASEHSVEGNIDVMKSLADRAVENTEDLNATVSFIMAATKGAN